MELRDPRYAVPLGVLLAIVVLSLALTRASSGDGRGGDAARGPEDVSPMAATRTPTPTGTPSLDSILLDLRRREDVVNIVAALQTYRGRYGSYPTTGGTTTTLCSNAEDAGCGLSAVAESLPAGDGRSAYWYSSDGESFAVVTRIDGVESPSDCPQDLPGELGGARLYCAAGKGTAP